MMIPDKKIIKPCVADSGLAFSMQVLDCICGLAVH